MFSKISVLLFGLFINGSLTEISWGQDGEAPPNIVFVLTDDQGYGDLGRHGHPFLKTPHLDKLAEESVRFENFYVSPSCSPTRAALLTGQHEFRNGVTHTTGGREKLSLDAVLLPEYLKKSGYRTGFVGKWHLGNDKPHEPASRGFDWTSTNQGGARVHFDPVMIRNGKRKRRKGFREDLFFDEAMAFIEESQDAPFFCYLATFSPHTPLAAPERDIAPFRDVVDEKKASYLGMITNIDRNMGRLMAFLEEKDLAKNSIVVFMNDNGVTEGLDIYNAGMRGCKCTIWEGGSRAMSFWRWPGHWKPHEVGNLTAHLDVFPTLCELAGTQLTESEKGSWKVTAWCPCCSRRGRSLGMMTACSFSTWRVGRPGWRLPINTRWLGCDRAIIFCCVVALAMTPLALVK